MVGGPAEIFYSVITAVSVNMVNNWQVVWILNESLSNQNMDVRSLSTERAALVPIRSCSQLQDTSLHCSVLQHSIKTSYATSVADFVTSFVANNRPPNF